MWRDETRAIRPCPLHQLARTGRYGPGCAGVRTADLGRTFTYAENGTAYGAEEYLPGRRVRWSFLDGQCKAGFWWEEAGQICFAYEDNPEPQCWRFFMGEAGLVAHYTSSDDAAPLYEVGQSSDPLLCLGPETGV